MNYKGVHKHKRLDDKKNWSRRTKWLAAREWKRVKREKLLIGGEVETP
jgi:hypothetical protein